MCEMIELSFQSSPRGIPSCPTNFVVGIATLAKLARRRLGKPTKILYVGLRRDGSRCHVLDKVSSDVTTLMQTSP